MLPKVSIVIPFYNDPYVDQAIQSALNQTYPNVEVVVVSDGSTEQLDKVKPFLHRIRFIEKENGGTASAVNKGIREAAGDYIAWLSSDDVYYPYKLERQMAYMLANRARICFTNFDRIDGSGQIIARSAGFMPRTTSEFYSTFLIGDPVNGCTVIAQKSLLLELGLYDVQLALAHDYDMWYRVILKGIDFYCLNDALHMHRTHERMREIRCADEVSQEVALLHARYNKQVTAYIGHMQRIGTW
jgi:teichuronic acid biosynthesis glycosyltransferase TuaG